MKRRELNLTSAVIACAVSLLFSALASCGSGGGGVGGNVENAPPKVSIVLPSSGTPGSEVTFEAIVSGTMPFSYDWNFGGGASPNTSSQPSPTVTLGSSATYVGTVTVTNDFGKDEFDFTLSVIPGGIPPKITGVFPDGGLADSEVTFSATVSGTAPLYFNWVFGGGAIPNTSQQGNATVLLRNSGTYFAVLTATNDYGVDRFEFTLTVT